MRTWGIYLIPRDKAPDEGFILFQGQSRGRFWRAHRIGKEDGTPVVRARHFSTVIHALTRTKDVQGRIIRNAPVSVQQPDRPCDGRIHPF